MKLIVYVTFFILGLFLSCNKNSNTTEKTFYENGKLSQEIFHTSDSTTIVYSYYENGNISSITSYINQIKNDFYMSFYESGGVSERGSFRNGKEDGTWYYYSENGLLIEKAQLVAMPMDDGPIAKEMLYYTSEMNLDTTKQIRYVETKSFIDTIYKGELYSLKLKLHQPYFKNGSMDIMLVDDHSKYYELSPEKLNNLIHCKGFNHLLQIKNYKIGHNEIYGVIINYDETGKLRMPYYFTQSFYVKELPH